MSKVLLVMTSTVNCFPSGLHLIAVRLLVAAPTAARLFARDQPVRDRDGSSRPVRLLHVLPRCKPVVWLLRAAQKLIPNRDVDAVDLYA